MSMDVGRKDGCIATINVTPMADVMIVLLIIFMVTIPIIDRDNLRLPPSANSREDDPKKALVLRLDDAGRLSIDKREVGPFEPALPEVALEAGAVPGRPVWIKASRGTDYASVAALLDACRRAGAEGLVLATEKPEVQ